MNTTVKTLLVSATLLFSSISQAGLITDTVAVDNWFDSFGETRSWTHDITDDGFTIDFDTVNSASLSFLFKDDEKDNKFWKYETAAIVIDEIDFQDGGVFEIDTGLLDLNVGISGILNINEFGNLFVSITRWTGDFYLGNVTLSTDVTPGVAAVPEPSIIALFGLGLLGLGLARRKVRS